MHYAIKLYGKGRRNFKQENLVEQFYRENVKIIDFCDPNYQEKHENSWMTKIRILCPQGLYYKRINHY